MAVSAYHSRVVRAREHVLTQARQREGGDGHGLDRVVGELGPVDLGPAELLVGLEPVPQVGPGVVEVPAPDERQVEHRIADVGELPVDDADHAVTVEHVLPGSGVALHEDGTLRRWGDVAPQPTARELEERDRLADGGAVHPLPDVEIQRDVLGGRGGHRHAEIDEGLDVGLVELHQLREKLVVEGAPALGLGDEQVVPLPRETLHQDPDRVRAEPVDLGNLHARRGEGPEQLELAEQRGTLVVVLWTLHACVATDALTVALDIHVPGGPTSVSAGTLTFRGPRCRRPAAPPR